MKAVRFLAGLVAVVLILVGAAVAILLGPDDTWGGDPAALDDSAPVVVTSPQLLNVAGITLVATARSADDGEVFVGAAHPVHVEDYVADITRTEVTALAAGGIDTTQRLGGERDYPSAEPAGLEVWEEQGTGHDVSIDVPLTDEAPVQIIALPTTAKEEAPLVGLGYKIPGAFVMGIVAAVVGLLLLVGTIMLGRRARRARAGQATAETAATTTGTTAPTALPRVAAVVTVGLLATGCSIPQQVEHDADAGIVPLADADVQTMLDDYDERNNAAIKASHSGDGSLWDEADTGPNLAVDMLAAKYNAVVKPKGKAGTFTHEGGTHFPTRQSAYPLWTAVETTTEATEEDDGAVLNLYVKEHAAEPWKGYSNLRLDGDLPTALRVDEATPSQEDLARGAEVAELLGTWVDKGQAPGLEVTKDLIKVRKDLTKVNKGVSRVANSTDPWGGGEFSAEPEGAVKVVRVEEGLLVITDQEWQHRAYLKPDFVWNYSDEEREVFGRRDDASVRQVNLSLTAAVLVPDSGDAEVLGADLSRVRNFSR